MMSMSYVSCVNSINMLPARRRIMIGSILMNSGCCCSYRPTNTNLRIHLRQWLNIMCIGWSTSPGWNLTGSRNYSYNICYTASWVLLPLWSWQTIPTITNLRCSTNRLQECRAMLWGYNPRSLTMHLKIVFTRTGIMLECDLRFRKFRSNWLTIVRFWRDIEKNIIELWRQII